ncbi:MAG: hypothetical protein DRJ37_04810 [Thermoprotei archaeon]|nr:MAG: hypothetical protein DRJ37_04810 [Thermoprotei archaeon]
MNTLVISLSLDDKLLEKINKLVDKLGYSNRSEAIRDAIRRLVAEYELSDFKKQIVLAAIMVIYDFNEGYIERKIAKIRHEYNDVVVGNLHMHVNGNYCAELLIAKGLGERVLSLIASIRGIKRLISLRHLLVPLEPYY